MKIEFVASVAVITPDAPASRRLYVDALGLPLKQLDGDYFASEEVGGCKHFGVWPLAQAAEACFGSPSWPDDVVRPQVSIEFEVADPESVAAGADELRSQGYELARREDGAVGPDRGAAALTRGGDPGPVLRPAVPSVSEEYSVVMTTTDSPEEARALARGLVENKLAACVQVVPVESHYEWQGALTESAELLLLVKTRTALYDEVERFLRERHSYETPEIVRLPVMAGSAAYLSWIDANTKAGP